ncbi:hypothetical protein GQ54DRAFT_158987 [Martensiomyces pterosporus]|nr:hypothetical protein GQ54DRAFT_158987 [Martensiomyces pterosporus]
MLYMRPILSSAAPLHAPFSLWEKMCSRRKHIWSPLFVVLTYYYPALFCPASLQQRLLHAVHPDTYEPGCVLPERCQTDAEAAAHPYASPPFCAFLTRRNHTIRKDAAECLIELDLTRLGAHARAGFWLGLQVAPVAAAAHNQRPTRARRRYPPLLIPPPRSANLLQFVAAS